MKFNGLHLSKNYIPLPKTLFTDLSKITLNWLVVWKMTWGIWQVFFRTLKIWILMGSFNPNWKIFELKIHKGVICPHNEELHKIWRGTDLSFQRWHEEFDKFWPEHLKISKMFTLMCSFWAKYKLLDLKKYTGVIFHETEEGWIYFFHDSEEICKFWRKTDLWFEKKTWKIWQIFTRALESVKIGTLMGSFCPK